MQIVLSLINLLYICQLKTNIYMARPIKETPELYGKDAERFEKLISRSKPASKEEKERARRAYEVMKTISNTQW